VGERTHVGEEMEGREVVRADSAGVRSSAELWDEDEDDKEGNEDDLVDMRVNAWMCVIDIVAAYEGEEDGVSWSCDACDDRRVLHRDI
jgi:hypothetical protein